VHRVDEHAFGHYCNFSSMRGAAQTSGTRGSG
jgi:hypothetical protein